MKRTIMPVALAAILALLLGLFLASKQSGTMPEQGLLYKEQQHASEIERVELSSHEGLILTASLEQEEWWIYWGNKQDEKKYLADRSKLSTFLKQLLEAKSIEAKTAKASNYSRLGVEAIENKDSQSRLLQLSANGKQWPALLIGKKAASGNGQYVRFAEEKQSWLIDKQLELPMLYSSWLKQPILELDKADVTQVVTTSSSKQFLWQLIRGEQGIKLAQLSENRELKYDSILEHTLDNLLTLKFQELKHRTEFEQEQLKLALTVNVTSNSQGTLVVDIYQDQQQLYWLSVAAETQQPWLYQISDISFSQLNKTAEDFLQPLEPQDEDISTSVEEGASPQ